MPVQPNHNKNLEKAFDACVNAINGLNNRQDLKGISSPLRQILNDTLETNASSPTPRGPRGP